MEMPAVGDHLIVEHHEHGGRKRVEVEVTQVARFRFVVRAAGPAASRLPRYFTEWDVRTGTAWRYTGNYPPRINTGQWWAEEDRRVTARAIVARKYGIREWDLRHDLRKAFNADPVRFAAVLEQFITSVNEEQQ